MPVEFYHRLVLPAIEGKFNHVPVFIDPKVNFDQQVREYTAIKVISPSIEKRVVGDLLPDSWDDTVLGLRLESIDLSLVEVLVIEKSGGIEVELYRADESGLLQPLYPEDLPKVIRLSDPNEKLGLAGKKKGEKDNEFLNAVRFVPVSTERSFD